MSSFILSRISVLSILPIFSRIAGGTFALFMMSIALPFIESSPLPITLSYCSFMLGASPLTQLLRFILVFLANQRFVFLICFTVFYKF